jgi:hypothetical protein
MRTAVAVALAVASAGCASGKGGGLGEILGSVLGGQGGQQGQGQQGQQGQAQGTIRGVDQSRIALQLADGQQVALQYDQRTTVSYQGQNYAVSNLEAGDRVTVAVQETGNGAYYVSAVRVDQSVQESNGGTSTGGGTSQAGVQQIQGVVRQIDIQNGLFSIETGNRAQYTVSLPYNASRADSDRFRSLRSGDQVRFYGVPLNNTRIELRQFY